MCELTEDEKEELDAKIEDGEYDEDVILSNVIAKEDYLEKGVIGSLGTINAIFELSSGKIVTFSGSANDIKLYRVSIEE